MNTRQRDGSHGARPLVLTLITRDPALAVAAIEGGVDRVLVDLERRGKAARQRGRRLFLSDHEWADVARLRPLLPPGALAVRIDPWHDHSTAQVERAIDLGVDAVMLPFFDDAATVGGFSDAVAGRALTIALVETARAVAALATIAALPGLGESHIGLNDLALSLGRPSLTELWGDPLLDRIGQVARASRLPFGIGGVTDPLIQGLPVDPRFTIGELGRLGATRALLGRSFRRPHETEPDKGRLGDSVRRIRAVHAAAWGHETRPATPAAWRPAEPQTSDDGLRTTDFGRKATDDGPRT